MSDAGNIPGEYFQGAKRKNSRKDVIEMLTIKLLTPSKREQHTFDKDHYVDYGNSFDKMKQASFRTVR